MVSLFDSSSAWYSAFYANRDFQKISHEITTLLSPIRNEKILDLGCGDGKIAATLAPFCKSIVGLDPSVEFIKKANEMYGDRVRYVRGYIQDLENSSFTRIYSYFHVLSYIFTEQSEAEFFSILREKFDQSSPGVFVGDFWRRETIEVEGLGTTEKRFDLDGVPHVRIATGKMLEGGLFSVSITIEPVSDKTVGRKMVYSQEKHIMKSINQFELLDCARGLGFEAKLCRWDGQAVRNSDREAVLLLKI
jgi:SAM-dependent methyltransferase